jgi:hypothetical protein
MKEEVKPLTLKEWVKRCITQDKVNYPCHTCKGDLLTRKGTGGQFLRAKWNPEGGCVPCQKSIIEAYKKSLSKS